MFMIECKVMLRHVCRTVWRRCIWRLRRVTSMSSPNCFDATLISTSLPRYL